MAYPIEVELKLLPISHYLFTEFEKFYTACLGASLFYNFNKVEPIKFQIKDEEAFILHAGAYSGSSLVHRIGCGYFELLPSRDFVGHFGDVKEAVSPPGQDHPEYSRIYCGDRKEIDNLRRKSHSACTVE